jgi:arylformamidase
MTSEIDAQYNPSLAVADPQQEMQHYLDAAQRARQTLRCTLDIPFGPTPAETLDIFPAERPGAPVFVFFHGGYWRALSSKDFSGVALGLQPLGITTVVVNYALCPVVTLDEIVRQARAALAWVQAHIGEHGGDASRLGLGGHSAGAHLAAMCLCDDAAGPAPAAGLLVSGLYDLAPLRHSYLQPVIQLTDALVQHQSPLRQVRRCTTPLWLTWGADESTAFAQQSAHFHRAWLAAGNAGMLEALPQAHHFSAIHGFEQPSSRLCQWLAQHLT